MDWRWLAALVAVGVTGSGVSGQVTQPSAIIGFQRIELNGAGVNGGVTLVGPTFVEGEVAQAVLQEGAPKPFELVVEGESWGAGIFTTHAEESSHYVEVMSSTNLSAVGLTSEILRPPANTANVSNKLAIADDWSGLLKGGETIVIRPHKTLAAVFGVANEAGLGAGDPLSADRISVLAEGLAPSFTTYYYRSGSSLGGSGWRSSGNPFADQTSRPLRTGRGLWLMRRGSEPMELVLHGLVKTGMMRRTLPSGFALVDPLAPVTDQRASLPLAGPAFTLGGASGAGVSPSGLETALTAGAPHAADLVSLAGRLASFYMAAPNGLSSGGWRVSSNPFVDQKHTVIPAATALLIQNRGATKRWSRPQPFVFGTPSTPLGHP